MRPDKTSGYLLDGYGGIHPFGGAPAFANTPYWAGFDIARGLEIVSDGAGVPTGGWVLDGWGGIHPFGTGAAAYAAPYYAGYDLWQRLHAVEGGLWLVGRFGILEPLGAPAAAPLNGIADWGNWDIVRDIAPLGATKTIPFDTSRELLCTGSGDYCGFDTLRGGTSALYHCTAAGQHPASVTVCGNGCDVKSAGVADACAPPPPPPPASQCSATGRAALDWEAAQINAGNSYSDLCLGFVNSAFVNGAGVHYPELVRYSAKDSLAAYQAEGKLQAWNGDAPCGSIVFWSANSCNGDYGHIVIANGDGTVSTSGWPGYGGGTHVGIGWLDGMECRNAPAGFVAP